MNEEIKELMMQLPGKAGLFKNSFPPAVQEKANHLIACYGDSKSFGSAFNPSLQKVVAANIERAFTGSAPTLTTINAAYGANPAEGWIMSQLEDFNKYTSVANKMDITQMEETAKLILLEYNYIKATELLLFFHWFKLGKYGTLYGSVDPLRIMNALREFSVDRRAEITRFEAKQRRERLLREREIQAKQAISYEEYLALKKRAREGDKEAIELLKTKK